MAGPIEVPSVPGHVLVRRAKGSGSVYLPPQPGVGQFHPVILTDHRAGTEEQAYYGDLPVVQTWHMQESEARERSDFEIVEETPQAGVPARPALISAPAAETPAEDGA